jgi:hypothetical protein
VFNLNLWEEQTMWSIWILFVVVGILRTISFLIEESRQKKHGIHYPIARHLSALDFHQPLNTPKSAA